jgi:hypothetical protein
MPSFRGCLTQPTSPRQQLEMVNRGAMVLCLCLGRTIECNCTEQWAVHDLQVGLGMSVLCSARLPSGGSKQKTIRYRASHHGLSALDAELVPELGQVCWIFRTIALTALYKVLFCSGAVVHCHRVESLARCTIVTKWSREFEMAARMVLNSLNRL